MSNTWDKVVESNKAYSEGVAYYKKQVELHRKEKKYGQEFSFILYERIKNYFAELESNDKPMTIAGIIRASGLNKVSFYQLKNGDFDYDLYAYMDSKGITFDDAEYYDGMPCYNDGVNTVLLIPLSELIEKIILMQEEEIETRLYEKGRVGDMFALKAKHSWIEEEKAPQVLNQKNIYIASLDEASEAIKLLK